MRVPAGAAHAPTESSSSSDITIRISLHLHHRRRHDLHDEEHTSVFFIIQIVPSSMMQVKGDSYGNVTAATGLRGGVSGPRRHSHRSPASRGRAGTAGLRPPSAP